MNIDTMIAVAEMRHESQFIVDGKHMLQIRDLRDAAALVVQSDGTYDLEHLSETLDNLAKEPT